MEKEIWVEVYDYYEISSKGRLKSFARYNEWKILSPISMWKYLWYQMWRKNKNYIHRLMWLAFLWLDINDSKKIILHKDDNPYNNDLDNLLIGTQLDNMRDMISKWRQRQWKVYRWWDHKRAVKYIQCTISWKEIKIWESVREAERVLKIDRSSISKAANWKLKKAGKFKWKRLTMEKK